MVDQQDMCEKLCVVQEEVGSARGCMPTVPQHRLAKLHLLRLEYPIIYK